jgi:hypothetical protein
MLSQSIMEGMYRSQFASFYSKLFRGVRSGSVYNGGVFGTQYFSAILLTMLSYVSMQVAIGAYIKFYVENDGRKPGIEEVWEIFKKYFFRVLLFSLPMGISIVLGAMFCLVPGVYLWVVLVPYSMVIMIEDTSFSETYYRCFNLVKDRFWMSFGIYFVVILIYYISSYVIGLMVSAIFGLGAYLTTKDLGITIGVVTSFFSIFLLSFYIIVAVSVAFQYFNLAEIKDGKGILQRISNLGSNDDDNNSIEEQY